jgi:DNA-binding IclR family transcriptional regulator
MFQHKAANPVGALETALDVLEQIRDSKGATLGELDEELPFAKSTIHRHVSTLMERGYVVKTGHEFDVSLQLFELASYKRERNPMFYMGRSVADDLAQRVDERVSMVIQEQGRAIKCYIAESNRSVMTDSRLGLTMHMHCTADGKAILAFKDDEYVRQVIEQRGLPEMTDNTITDREALYDELATIREESISLDDQERLPGVRGISAPVIDEDSGGVLGAFGITGPATRVEGEMFRKRYPELVRRAADEIAVNVQYWRENQSNVLDSLS